MKRMIDASKLPKGPFVLHRLTHMGTLNDECTKAVELLAEYGLNCTNCFFSGEDTLEIGAQRHGMTDEELDSMIDEINTELAKEQKK